MTKRAVVLGVAGMDGSHCADLLLSKGYQVRGVSPCWASTANVAHLLADEKLNEQFKLTVGDITDAFSLHRIIGGFEPDEIYNFADMDGIGHSFECPNVSWEVTANGPRKLLQVVREVCPRARVFQALSITMFGLAPPPQGESTPLNPLSPYACAKAAAWHLCRLHRQVHGLYVSCGIFCNHTSPRQGSGYLLPTIVGGALRLAEWERSRSIVRYDPAARPDPIVLRNLSQIIDVGWAPDFVDAAWRSLQQDTPDDYVIATGQSTYVEAIVAAALREAGVRLPFGDVVRTSSEPCPDHRPAGKYVGNPSRALERLGWEPQTTWQQVVDNLIHSHKTGGRP